MKLLILGGTVFVGRHLVEAALARGHNVTLFNRGRHNPDLFPDVETIRGDRDGQLAHLGDRRWDAVIDTCGYVPRLVGASAGYLADRVDHYTFISTISVYAEPHEPGLNEAAQVGRLDDPDTEEVTGESYGPLKALCEAAAAEAMPGRVLTVRPGLIVGPHDPTDRFTYWPVRIRRGGALVAPGNPGQPVQIIDVRDLAAWTLTMVEAGATGVYNATGPETPLVFAGMLAACQAASDADARPIWMDDDFLLAQEVQPFADLPLWLPDHAAALFRVDISKAMAAGLRFRPLAETVADTLAWVDDRPQGEGLAVGLSRAREQAILAAWQDRG